jgi:hypothetical protein
MHCTNNWWRLKCWPTTAEPGRDEVWYGVRALVPATLELIAQLRRREPEWFEIGY